MNRFLDLPCDPLQCSALNLAFIGDAVFDLLVRETLVCQANRPVRAQHAKASSLVKASSQAAFAKKIAPLLNETEEAILRRGRNAHTNHKAKNATESDYHYATALEALIGYLYLSGQTDRLRELFDHLMEEEA